jgi:hypothetical protein
VNIYTHRFTAKCPNNSRVVTYNLTIESHDTIMVESLQSEILNFDIGYHEQIADKLFERFGGRQTITAHHHGTHITTIRP